MVIKPAISFLRTHNDAALVTEAKTILSSLTDNSAYPSPSPALAAIITATNDFSAAISNAADGGVTLTAIKNAKRQALSALLRHLAGYVHMACNGDMAALLSSGFPIQKPTRTPAGILPAPATPALHTGSRSGDLAATTSPVANGSSYNWRVALASAPNDYVQEVQTTAARITFSGLTPGQVYAVDVNVFGSAGPSDWSDTAELMVV